MLSLLTIHFDPNWSAASSSAASPDPSLGAMNRYSISQAESADLLVNARACTHQRIVFSYPLDLSSEMLKYGRQSHGSLKPPADAQ